MGWAYRVMSLSHNPVPTLLGDILHPLYARTTRKRGTLMCCAPLLAGWFISLLPQLALKKKEGMGGADRVVSLTLRELHYVD